MVVADFDFVGETLRVYHLHLAWTDLMWKCLERMDCLDWLDCLEGTVCLGWLDLHWKRLERMDCLDLVQIGFDYFGCLGLGIYLVAVAEFGSPGLETLDLEIPGNLEVVG